MQSVWSKCLPFLWDKQYQSNETRQDDFVRLHPNSHPFSSCTARQHTADKNTPLGMIQRTPLSHRLVSFYKRLRRTTLKSLGESRHKNFPVLAWV